MTATQEDLDLTVDRSPELLRGAIPVSIGRRPSNLTLVTEGAVRGDGGKCALAKAVCELPGIREAHIEGERPYLITDEGKTLPVCLDSEVAEWIGRFDRGEPVEPMEVFFSFDS